MWQDIMWQDIIGNGRIISHIHIVRNNNILAQKLKFYIIFKKKWHMWQDIICEDMIWYTNME